MSSLAKVFSNKVKDRENVAIVGFATDRDVFGGFFNVPVTELEERFNDRGVFEFSFESHGAMHDVAAVRLETVLWSCV